MEWQLVSNDSPGYLGARRDKDRAERDTRYGKGSWKVGWPCGDEVLDYVGACKLYEDAYTHFLVARPEILEHLCRIAKDVYDDSESNVSSGFDYEAQETERTHIQDIAIRNSLLRLKRRFEGERLVQIRGVNKEAVSLALSPGQVPFHLPGLITKPDNMEEVYERRWWLPGSVEDFYQLNKRIYVLK